MTQGRWSDGVSTLADVGVWGHREPDINAGDCTYLMRGSGTSWSWHMANCDLDLPFACQATPCPDSECGVDVNVVSVCLALPAVLTLRPFTENFLAELGLGSNYCVYSWPSCDECVLCPAWLQSEAE